MNAMLCTGLVYLILGSGIAETFASAKGLKAFISPNGVVQLVFEPLTASCDMQGTLEAKDRFEFNPDGDLKLSEVANDEGASIAGVISGFNPTSGKVYRYGLAVHEFGVRAARDRRDMMDCTVAGGRFNDLGILQETDFITETEITTGTTINVKITNSTASLYGDSSIIGLSLVLYSQGPVFELNLEFVKKVADTVTDALVGQLCSDTPPLTCDPFVGLNLIEAISGAVDELRGQNTEDLAGAVAGAVAGASAGQFSLNPDNIAKAVAGAVAGQPGQIPGDFIGILTGVVAGAVSVAVPYLSREDVQVPEDLAGAVAGAVAVAVNGQLRQNPTNYAVAVAGAIGIFSEQLDLNPAGPVDSAGAAAAAITKRIASLFDTDLLDFGVEQEFRIACCNIRTAGRGATSTSQQQER